MFLNTNSDLHPTTSLQNINSPLPHSDLKQYASNEKEEKCPDKNEIQRLKQLFHTRFLPSTSEVANFEACLDCESLAHYLTTGTIGSFDDDPSNEIRKVDSNQKHDPYTCYKIWQPTPLLLRNEMGFWGPTHYFVHLEHDRCISVNGYGPVRIFKSFKEMLEKDAFPSGFVTENNEITSHIEQAVIGESRIGTLKDSPV